MLPSARMSWASAAGYTAEICVSSQSLDKYAAGSSSVRETNVSKRRLSVVVSLNCALQNRVRAHPAVSSSRWAHCVQRAMIEPASASPAI
jgi:hypothetical protein